MHVLERQFHPVVLQGWSQSLAGGESRIQVFVHLLWLNDEWPGVYDDDRYFEKGRRFNRGGQGRMRLWKVKRFAVNCVYLKVAAKQEIPQPGSPRVIQVPRVRFLCSK